MTVVKPEQLSAVDAPDGPASGFTCPWCGGSIWETTGESLSFQCRIGHKLSLGGMLADHGASRRRKLVEAGRLLAEAAALNRRVAHYAEERGHTFAAARLEQEAAALEQRSSEVMQLAVSGLIDPAKPAWGIHGAPQPRES